MPRQFCVISEAVLTGRNGEAVHGAMTRCQATPVFHRRPWISRCRQIVGPDVGVGSAASHVRIVMVVILQIYENAIKLRNFSCVRSKNFLLSHVHYAEMQFT